MTRWGRRLAAGAALAVAACGKGGSPRESTAVSTMSLESAAFAPGGTVPVEHTCDGSNLSPPLRWSAPPPGTQSLAVACEDPDAPGKTWVHWVLYDLPPGARELPAGVPVAAAIPGGGIQGTNDFARLGYGGPCPPPGKPHRYVFRIYALDVRLGLPAGEHLTAVRRALEGHALAQGEMIGTYARR